MRILGIRSANKRHSDKKRCPNCFRSIGGFGFRCRTCGWTDASIVVYGLLMLIIAGASLTAIPYVLGTHGNGEATYTQIGGDHGDHGLLR